MDMTRRGGGEGGGDGEGEVMSSLVLQKEHQNKKDTTRTEVMVEKGREKLGEIGFGGVGEGGRTREGGGSAPLQDTQSI